MRMTRLKRLIKRKLSPILKIVTFFAIPVFGQFYGNKLFAKVLHLNVRNSNNVSSVIELFCVAVAKLSKALASFFARGSSPATTHIGRPHSVWMAALGTSCSTLICSVWADSARCDL